MRRGVLCAVCLLLVLFGGAGLEGAEPEEFVSLELSPVEIQEIGERCPVRVELPVPALDLGDREQTVGVLARYVHCQGVRISHVQVGAKQGPINLVELKASAHVIAPKGEDSAADLVYEFVDGDGESYSARQYLKLDEGERNWGGGATVRVPEAVDLSSLRLRIEMTTPAERR